MHLIIASLLARFIPIIAMRFLPTKRTRQARRLVMDRFACTEGHRYATTA